MSSPTPDETPPEHGPALSFGDARVEPLFRRLTTVGRVDRTGQHPDIDLTELDPERSVSRRHAEVRVVSGEASICDLGSVNGTELNSQLLPASRVAALRDGDVVAFGDVVATFRARLAWPAGLRPEWEHDDGTRYRPPKAADRPHAATAVDATDRGSTGPGAAPTDASHRPTSAPPTDSEPRSDPARPRPPTLAVTRRPGPPASVPEPPRRFFHRVIARLRLRP